MSETILAPTAALPPRALAVRGRGSRLNPLEALERGFALFRSTLAEEAWRYYAGSAPLVFCFIPMWVVNGQIRLSNGVVLMEAAVLAAAYVLRVCMVASYMQRVRERAFGTPTSKPVGASARAAALGRLMAWKITLSASAIVALITFAGAPWFYSACQFASLEAREDRFERHSMRGCMAIASQWFGSSVLLFLMIFPLWAAVWLNGVILAMVFPQLLHSIFGVNTLLSTPVGIFALVRSSAFWLSLLAGAWLALDPIVKCSFVVVYQHLRSRRGGDDLRGMLANLPHEQEKKAQMMVSTPAGSRVIGALVVLALILAAVSEAARAEQTPPAPRSAETLTDSARDARIQQLRQALDVESRRAIYRWHDAEHPSPPNWFDKLLTKIGLRIGRAWKAFWNFLRKLWPHGLNLSLGNDGGRHWELKDLRAWLWLIAILTLAAGTVLLWLRRRRETAPHSIPQTIAPLPDLSEGALASVRSEDEWFALAGRLEGEGELRFALRAAYFGLLAGLAQREWLTIRRDRTNREYLDEFTRRWRRRPQAAVEARVEIPEKLRGSLRQFDRVWYGYHVLTPEAVASYRQDQRELLNHV
ncbi:MAG TPA: hypothetical protein VK828_14075 [Terriglobales bacterium]|jgi:hypothetical protein|nr:hypothetical protein [Terriglobales bacterium]